MKFLKAATVIGAALAFAGSPSVANAEGPPAQSGDSSSQTSAQSPQKAKTGVGESAGNAAGGLFNGTLTTANLITGVVVLTAIGVAVAASTDDETPTTTTPSTTQ